MVIKLISPRMSLRPMDSEYKRVLSPSLSLAIVAGLTPKEHRIVIEDQNVKPIKFDDHPDLVGITVNVDTSRNAYNIAERYRARGVPVILGGIHASACPDECLRFADAVCVGEAEDVWERVIADAASGRLSGRYRSDKPAPTERTPLPRWDLLDANRYLYTNIMAASRGCPFACEFCYNSCEYVHNCHRNRPLQNVLEEIDLMGTRQVMFVDDNFIGNPKWAMQFCEAAMARGLTWHCAVSANVGRYPALLDAMAASGCRSLFIGFESINKASIAGVGKKQNKVDSYEELIAQIHRRGMMINASMVFGFDDDTPAVFEDTLQWLIANRIETMTAHVLTPYPGTVLYERLKREGRIVDHESTHYNTSHAVFEPKQMTRAQLREGYLWIYLGLM